MSSRIFSDSTICTGSDYNHRTFSADESWNSLQSTILGGMNLTGVDNVESRGNREKSKLELTTVTEEEDSIMSRGSRDGEVDVLNVNLDALTPISDDDVFFDCFGDPANTMLFSPRKRAAVSPTCLTTTTNDLTSNHGSTTAETTVSADSGLPDGGKTGSLFVEMVDEFKQINDHAHSTPKRTSITDLSSLSSLQQVSAADQEAETSEDKRLFGLSQKKKKLDFSIGKKLVITYTESTQSSDGDNKENYFGGRYTDVVVKRKKPKPTPRFVQPGNTKVSKPTPRFLQSSNVSAKQRFKSPGVKFPRRSVAKIAEYFENRSKSSNDQSHFRKLESSKKNSASKSSSQASKSPSFFKTKSKSPKYHPRGTYKLLKASTENTLNFTPSNRIVLIRHKPSVSLRSARPSSCSEVPTNDTKSVSQAAFDGTSLSRRSKSASDLSIDHTNLIKAVELRRIAVRHTKTSRAREENRSRKLTPSKAKTDEKQSEIMKRKSLGFVSTPVKPVQELKKIFSPAAGRAGNKSKSAYGRNLTTTNIPSIRINADE